LNLVPRVAKLAPGGVALGRPHVEQRGAPVSVSLRTREAGGRITASHAITVPPGWGHAGELRAPWPSRARPERPAARSGPFARRRAEPRIRPPSCEAARLRGARIV